MLTWKAKIEGGPAAKDLAFTTRWTPNRERKGHDEGSYEQGKHEMPCRETRCRAPEHDMCRDEQGFQGE